MYEKLRKLREKKNITQKQMAKMLGFKSINAYSLKERGERKFTVEEALQISKLLKISVEDIFLKTK